MVRSSSTLQDSKYTPAVRLTVCCVALAYGKHVEIVQSPRIEYKSPLTDQFVLLLYGTEATSAAAQTKEFFFSFFSSFLH